MTVIKKTAISVQESKFDDSKTQEKKKMWKVFVVDDNCGVGSIYSAKEVRTGDTVEIGLVANKDGRLMAKIVGIIPASPAFTGSGKKNPSVPE